MECFICFNNLDMTQNNFYLECCKNYIHKECIYLWSCNENNKNNNKCPYCRIINKNIIDLSNQYLI